MRPKTSFQNPHGSQRTGTDTKHIMVINLNKLNLLDLITEDLTRGTTKQFAQALQISAKSLDTTFSCCNRFIADKVSFQTKDHWFYVSVDKKFLSTYWTGDSSDKVHNLLGRAFGMFAVLTLDPTKHQVLLEGELESAIETSKGLLPQYVSMNNPTVSHVANLVNFEA